MKTLRMTTHSAVAVVAAAALTGAFLTVSAADAGAAPAVATATKAVTHQQNERVPEGASWTQHYFPSSDGSDTELHADVLLPEGLAAGEKVPVILSIGPYFGHSGQKSKEDWKHAGPSARFSDLFTEGGLFKKKYAFVMVDSRGFGGSSGCIDFAGPDEQADVRAAIDWAASRSWSTGAVGMYGKSYDALTGLIGNNLNQDALKAVVAQEPVWDPYRNPHSNGIQRLNMFLVPSTYSSIAALPQLPDDDAKYKANAAYEASHPYCLDAYTAGYLENDQRSPHWRARDVPAQAKGSDTPLFFTQGFIEDNTKPEDMQEYLANHRGPKRAWMGQWDHVRGNDRDKEGRLKMGRAGWFAEVFAFYDEHLKGIAPTAKYPAFAVQDSTGKWRAQQQWPVTSRDVTVSLGRGAYLEDGGADAYAALAEAGLPVPPPPAPDPDNPSEASAGGLEPVIPKELAALQVKRAQQGRVTSALYKFSQPVAKATRLTGTPRVSLDARGSGNMMVKLYDVAPGGKAVIINENVSLLSRGRTTFDLKSTDWTLAPGHVLGVEIGAVQTGSWYDLPSRDTVRVADARLRLALGDPARDVATQGDPSLFMATYLQRHQVNLTAQRPSFTLPAAR
ncbi:CocE/NonD family hydrolase [Paractinoplanes lichenicola]|uniref:CocE/NonD family hydrolase n=1 Tax=Paractinoplanes lichenicola TaxID=2802976 RepID=A0ABS1VEC3_9ACTN|nr:CocE/NonD family hydrolase [Actinoplanes lichenicola]MBL7253043.1 CocE/NonD family hydrolase [Actinoplanes lichenicola]